VDHRHHAANRRLEDCYVMASLIDHCLYMLLLAVQASQGKYATQEG